MLNGPLAGFSPQQPFFFFFHSSEVTSTLCEGLRDDREKITFSSFGGWQDLFLAHYAGFCRI